MVAERNRAAAAQDGRKEWPHLLSLGGMLAAVLGVLFLGAALRTEVPSAATPAPLPAPQPGSADPPSGLQARARRDVARLSASGASWTAQLGLFCEPVRARELSDRFGDLAAFYLLPSGRGPELCFRVCWGGYATAELAKAARDLPDSMRDRFPDAFPKRVAEVVE